MTTVVLTPQDFLDPVALANKLAAAINEGDGAGLEGFTATYVAEPYDGATNPAGVLQAYDGTDATDPVDVVLMPGGQREGEPDGNITYGAIQATLSDGTPIGGNQRGTGAVDFQMFRTDPSQVASGISAFAAGSANVASGWISTAFGDANEITGFISYGEGSGNVEAGSINHVEGADNTADGTYVHVEGEGNNVGGVSMHVEGSGNTAEGELQYVHVEGYQNTVNNSYSHAEGSGNTINAGGAYSHVEGNGNSTSGNAAHAEGSGTQANGAQSHAEGSGTLAESIGDHAEGVNTAANSAGGGGAHAEGLSTAASGPQSHAEGNTTQALSNGDHAEGYNTTANSGGDGNYGAHAEGDSTQALNDGAHSEGGYTVASGYNSHAEGQSTVAAGDSSRAEGINTAAYGYASRVEGNFATDYGVSGVSVRGAYGSSILGHAQSTIALFVTETEDATPTVMTIDNQDPSTINQVILGQDNALYFADVYLTGKVTGASDWVSIWAQVTAQRGTGAASVTIPTSVGGTNPALALTSYGSVTGLTWGSGSPLALVADTDNGALQIQITGAADTNIQWYAEVRTREQVF
jgi:hypothetical protein